MAEKEVFKGVLLGFVLLLSFTLIVLLVVAQLPAPPPTPESPESGSAPAPSTPGTPGGGDGGAPPTPGTPSGEDGGAPSTPGTPPSGDGVAPSGDGTAPTGGDGDYARRRAGEGYTYEAGEAPSTAGITTPTQGAAPTVTGTDLEGAEELSPQEGEEVAVAPRTGLVLAKKDYVRITILALLVILAIAAIVWAILRWKAHKEESNIPEEEIRAAAEELYLQSERPQEKPAANKGPLPPGMR